MRQALSHPLLRITIKPAPLVAYTNFNLELHHMQLKTASKPEQLAASTTKEVEYEL